MRHTCSWSNYSGHPILLATKDCSQSRTKKGTIGFIVPNNYSINDGDYLVRDGVEFQILKITASKPSKAYPDYTYYYAEAKMISQPIPVRK